MGETIGRVGWRTFGSATPTSSYLLDTYGGASTAYSLRKLSSTYAGFAIRVRRSSDNTEQNIGFDESGNLDTTTLLSFVGSGNGFVTTWYDQSGNVNNMIQANANQQPKIVLSGVVNMTNSKPSIRFQNSGLYNTQPTFSAPISIFSVINNNSTSGGNYFIYSNANTSETYGSTIGLVNGNWRIQAIGGAYIYGLNSGEIFGNKLISTVMASNGAWDLFTNTTELFNNSITGGNFNLNALGYRSNLGGVFYSDYDLRETIIYPSDKRTSRSGINSNINTYYSLYSSYTTRTSAFATATGITDTTILNALNTFDAGLISNGLDTKMKALYPFVGGTANTHKFNFMDARDSDAAFRLQFNGGWVHNATGAKPNGSNGYANTYLSPYTQLTLGSRHLSMYASDNSQANQYSIDMGAYDSAGQKSNHLSIRRDADLVVGQLNNWGNQSLTSNNNTKGLLIVNRPSISSSKAFKNNVLIASTTNDITGQVMPNFNMFLGGSNDNGGFAGAVCSSRGFSLSSIGSGLSDTEASAFYALVQAFQTSLSRAV